MTAMSRNIEVPKRHLSISTTVCGSIHLHATFGETIRPPADVCCRNNLFPLWCGTAASLLGRQVISILAWTFCIRDEIMTLSLILNKMPVPSKATYIEHVLFPSRSFSLFPIPSANFLCLWLWVRIWQDGRLFRGERVAQWSLFAFLSLLKYNVLLKHY